MSELQRSTPLYFRLRTRNVLVGNKVAHGSPNKTQENSTTFMSAFPHELFVPLNVRNKCSQKIELLS